jgi:hypothetical protein
VYHSSVPSTRNEEKIELLNNFSLGVRAVGDEILDVRGLEYVKADVGVIQGWLGSGEISSRHLMLRNTVIQEQLASNKYVVSADSNLFLYANTSNPYHYLRYSFNGVFPNTGIYCDYPANPQRWKSISSKLGISVKDYRTNGSHILILLQRNGGWSMGTFDVQDWAVDTIEMIRRHTDRPIVVRAHPGDKSTRKMLGRQSPECKIKFSKRVVLSTNESLLDDLKDCWAAVNHNSSPVVGAAIEGVPIFVTDPVRSQCKEIANTDLTKIDNPELHDRQAWLERISMFHWNFEEVKSGQCWRHMRQYIK